MNQQDNGSASTQPNIPLTRRKRTRKFLFSAFGVIVLLALGIFGGYQSGVSTRRNTQSSALMEQLGEQFQFALVDYEFGRYEIARQRLEFILEQDTSFPGAQEKLTDVLVQINLQANYVSPTATPSLTPTPDFSGAEQAYTRAQQLIATQDWPGTLGALDELRKLDPTYQVSQVDGMYYFALRNNGYDLITTKGNLEGGIYYLTLAERFGPLDVLANGVREGARYYILGASFWELNWEQTLFYFNQVYTGWPGLWDGTMTAGDRYRNASMRYGDEFFGQEKFCEAVIQYDNAQRVGPLDQLASQNYAQALIACFPPTGTPDPSLLFTPTPATDVVPTLETPVVAPTDTPVTPAATP